MYAQDLVPSSSFNLPSATALGSGGFKFFCFPSTSNCGTNNKEIGKGLLKQACPIKS